MDTKPLVELPTATGSLFVNPEDIISVRANNKTVLVSLENHDDEKQVKLNFGQAEGLLDYPYFLTCHRSFRINILKIKEKLKEGKIRLKNGALIPLSEKCQNSFDEALKAYCKNRGGGVNC
jgi:DNA-binding LytR/AlgR family response regulator